MMKDYKFKEIDRKSQSLNIRKSRSQSLYTRRNTAGINNLMKKSVKIHRNDIEGEKIELINDEEQQNFFLND